MSNSLRVFTWNVQGRTKTLDKQADRVLRDSPDVVCLQEITAKALTLWTERMTPAGYTVVASAEPSDGRTPWTRSVLIATRLPLTHVAQPVDLPCPHRSLVIEVQPPRWPQPLRVVCLHAPNVGNPDRVKMETLKAMYANLCGLAAHVPVALCGDLNTPWSEAPDGTVQTFGQTPTGKLKARDGEGNDSAERMILKGPPGWSDAFRTLHTYAALDRSWKAHNGTGPGFRLDHILLSPALTAVACAYDHDVREGGLSDHSAMYATFELTSAALIAA
jgi:exonuclease III